MCMLEVNFGILFCNKKSYTTALNFFYVVQGIITSDTSLDKKHFY